MMYCVNVQVRVSFVVVGVVNWSIAVFNTRTACTVATTDWTNHATTELSGRLTTTLHLVVAELAAKPNPEAKARSKCT
jgi:hypothetical protein